MTFALMSKSQTKQATSKKPAAKRKPLPNRHAMEVQPGLGIWGIRPATAAPTIQTKLKIGEPNDKYEQEADRVAEQVMRMPNNAATGPATFSAAEYGSFQNIGNTASPEIQRLCPECEEKLQRQPVEEEEETVFRRKKDNGGTSEVMPGLEMQISNLRGKGNRLPKSLRTFFEPRFGLNFEHVKIHTDSKAAKSAQTLNARAYTVGQNIVFGADQYAPGTVAGKRLLAHELTHTLQQGTARKTQVTEQYKGFFKNQIQSSTLQREALIQRAPPSKSNSSQSIDSNHLRELMRRFASLLPDRTRNYIVRNMTVAIGVVQVDKDITTLVYTINKNRMQSGRTPNSMSNDVIKAMDTLGAERWSSIPRTEGRGSVGAPTDAEQLMIEAADTNNAKIRAMVVSRGMCKDCKVATAHEGILVVEEQIRARSSAPVQKSKSPKETAKSKKKSTLSKRRLPTKAVPKATAPKASIINAEAQAIAREASASLKTDLKLLRAARILTTATQILQAIAAIKMFSDFTAMTKSALSGRGFILTSAINTAESLEKRMDKILKSYTAFSESLSDMSFNLLKSGGDPLSAGRTALNILELQDELESIEENLNNQIKRVRKAFLEAKNKEKLARSILQDPKAVSAIAVVTFGTAELATIFAASQDLQRIRSALGSTITSMKNLNKLLEFDIDFLNSWFEALFDVCERGNFCSTTRIEIPFVGTSTVRGFHFVED